MKFFERFSRKEPEESPDDIFKETPFKNSLKDSGDGERIKNLLHSPDKIIRLQYLSSDESAQRQTEQIREAFGIIAELRDRYHIPVPKYELVVGTYKNERKLFVVADKITGETVDKLETIDEKQLEQIDDLYSTLADYYYAKFKDGGRYWDDFHSGQFMLGHPRGEKEDKMYLVDIEPRSAPVEKGDVGEGSIWDQLDALIRAVISIEHKSHKKLEQTRAALEQIFEIIAKTDSGKLINETYARAVHRGREQLHSGM